MAGFVLVSLHIKPQSLETDCQLMKQPQVVWFDVAIQSNAGLSSGKPDVSTKSFTPSPFTHYYLAIPLQSSV